MHYGRDALTGAALFLSHLATAGITCSGLRDRYPDYYISKNKISLGAEDPLDKIIDKIAGIYGRFELNREDGLKIDMPEGWIHMRRSNTEPIIRIYSEAGSIEKAESLSRQVIDLLRDQG
jgi:phosphomannomutase